MSDSLFDTHCHLDFPHYTDDREAVFARMAEAGVEGCVVVGVDYEHVSRLKGLAEAHDHVWFSVGIHPNHEIEHEPSVDLLCELADHPRCVAIGETGLDFFRHHVDPAVQEERFRTHIRAAQRLDKPVIVHNRDADTDSIRVLQEEICESGGIMHCFSADWETASAALDLGMYISFSGNVTFKNNQVLREVAAKVPAEMLLIETDSPYLAPMPHRGQRNEPAYVRKVAECLAEVRSLPVSELARQTTDNARRVFRLA